MSESSLPYRRHGSGLEISVRLQPAAGRAAVEGVQAMAEGGVALKVRVTEVPENGKANAALIKLLARALKVPKNRLEIISGQKQRNKRLLLLGDVATLEPRFLAWIAGLGSSGESATRP